MLEILPATATLPRETWGPCTTMAFWKPGEKKNQIYLCINGTTCTDYLTDKLMYPEIAIGVRTHSMFDQKVTRVVVAYQDERAAKQMITFGMPWLHKIEQANNFRKTKAVRYDNKIVYTSSGRWMHSTFTLSLYLKLLRNLMKLDASYETYDEVLYKLIELRSYDHFDLKKPFLTKLIFNGKLIAVNRGCRYKHGWKNKLDGNHSNNGIRYSQYGFEVLFNNQALDRYERQTKEDIKKRFKRIKNMLKLAKELGETS